ncbi:MAG: NYN domain-containing protein [Luteimonas sp.]|nr:NYN domain-containing protein [Luteimonas sp.]
MEATMRIALLIDADNASAATLDHVLSEIADLGVANVRRAYGDWANPSLRSWREALLSNAIQPIQQVAYTIKGNASDMAMVIDAMDLMHSGRFDAFALMSSDSDFTPLVMRLRAANMRVYGFGKTQTPNAFKVACSVFFHVDAPDEAPSGAEARSVEAPVAAVGKGSTVEPATTSAATAPSSAESAAPPSAPGSQPTVKLVQPPSRKTGAQLRSDTNLVNLLRNAVQAAKGEDGWSHLGQVGNHIVNRGPFTPKNYGYSALKPLVVATELFEVRKDGNHIRAKPKPAKAVKVVVESK